jgi:hypothetical protein
MDYKQKYLKYKKKYLKLIGGLKHKPIEPYPFSIFYYILNIAFDEIVHPQIDEEISNDIKIDIENKITISEYLVKYVLLFSVLEPDYPTITIEKIIKTINFYLRRLNSIYIIDYLNIIGHIRNIHNMTHEEAEKKFMIDLQKRIKDESMVRGVSDQFMYVICGRSDNLFRKYITINKLKSYPPNIIFMEGKTDQPYGVIDDFIFWTIAIAFSAFTQDVNFNVNNVASKKNDLLPNLMLITNDKQKLYDITKSGNIKNLHSELKREKIEEIFINGESNKFLFNIFYLIQSYIINAENNIDVYSKERNGSGLDNARYCINNNPYDFNTSINNFCTSLYADNDGTLHDRNCNNFEKYMSVVKYVQFNSFKDKLSLNGDKILKFLDGQI